MGIGAAPPKISLEPFLSMVMHPRSLSIGESRGREGVRPPPPPKEKRMNTLLHFIKFIVLIWFVRGVPPPPPARNFDYLLSLIAVRSRGNIFFFLLRPNFQHQVLTPAPPPPRQKLLNPSLPIKNMVLKSDCFKRWKGGNSIIQLYHESQSSTYSSKLSHNLHWTFNNVRN